MLKIALAGNPNSGKTTMFNDLTGSSQRVGNWPGVTVEKKEGKLKGHSDVTIVDLPGIYSLSPYSPEEIVTRNFLLNERPDAIINIVDASNLERNLYLTTQMLDTGIPVVIALNMIDIVQKRGDTIDLAGLGKCLGCEVVETSAIKGIGSKAAAEKAIEAAKAGRREPKKMLSDKFEGILYDIEAKLKGKVNDEDLRWYSVKMFERDEKIVAEKPSEWKEIGPIVSAFEEEMDDDSESIIANERYEYIVKVVKKNLKRSDKVYVSTTDKIDRVVTNRWLALPIFAVVMIGVYYISVTTVGSFLTDWVNETVFGEWIIPGVNDFLVNAGVADWLTSLIVDGIIAGVGAVIGFLPQMLVLFILLVILEDCGYMARIAFIMDRVFRRFGLSGKSFIPALIGTGCGVPGITASRTIESESDRKITAMTVTFMPCSAKLPIIALIAGAIFSSSWWIAPAAYFIGIAALLVSGIILKKFKRFTGKPSPFIMELPEYHAPRLKNIGYQASARTWAFVKKAGTVVLLASIVIWFLASFDTSMTLLAPEDIGSSILADIGNVIAPIFSPLGWGDWQSAVATFTGLVAKENVVGTFGILFGFGEVSESGEEIWSLLAAHYTELAAFSFLVFNLLCAPCIAAMGAMYKELGGWKGALFAIGYQCGFAYAIALLIYQFGEVLAGNGFTPWTIVAIAVLALLVYLLVRRGSDEKENKEGATW